MSLESHGKSSVPAKAWDTRPERSGKGGRSGRPFETAGLGAVDRGRRPNEGGARYGMGNNARASENCAAAMANLANGVATVGVTIARTAPLVLAVEVRTRRLLERSSMRLHALEMRSVRS